MLAACDIRRSAGGETVSPGRVVPNDPIGVVWWWLGVAICKTQPVHMCKLYFKQLIFRSAVVLEPRFIHVDIVYFNSNFQTYLILLMITLN
jgi:hypothetical protein